MNVNVSAPLPVQCSDAAVSFKLQPGFQRTDQTPSELLTTAGTSVDYVATRGWVRFLTCRDQNMFDCYIVLEKRTESIGCFLGIYIKITLLFHHVARISGQIGSTVRNTSKCLSFYLKTRQ